MFSFFRDDDVVPLPPNLVAEMDETLASPNLQLGDKWNIINAMWWSAWCKTHRFRGIRGDLTTREQEVWKNDAIDLWLREDGHVVLPNHAFNLLMKMCFDQIVPCPKHRFVFIRDSEERFEYRKNELMGVDVDSVDDLTLGTFERLFVS